MHLLTEAQAGRKRKRESKNSKKKNYNYQLCGPQPFSIDRLMSIFSLLSIAKGVTPEEKHAQKHFKIEDDAIAAALLDPKLYSKVVASYGTVSLYGAVSDYFTCLTPTIVTFQLG
jgi:hypothetical protein